MKDILLFNFDNITVNKSIENTIIKLFNNNYILGLVTSYEHKKISKKYGTVLLCFKYLFCETGKVVYENDYLVRKLKLKKYCNKNILNNLIKKTFETLANMPIKYNGQHVHMKYSSVHISLPGLQSSKRAIKKFAKLDKELKLRKMLLDELLVVDVNSEFDISLDDFQGINISVKGWNNKLIGDYLKKELGLKNKIYYFGNKTTTDALYDYPDVVSITDCKDFCKKLELYLIKNLIG